MTSFFQLKCFHILHGIVIWVLGVSHPFPDSRINSRVYDRLVEINYQGQFFILEQSFYSLSFDSRGFLYIVKRADKEEYIVSDFDIKVIMRHRYIRLCRNLTRVISSAVSTDHPRC